MFKVKIFRGSHASTKIFYLEFFINEIFSVEKFPNYGTFFPDKILVGEFNFPGRKTIGLSVIILI